MSTRKDFWEAPQFSQESLTPEGLKSMSQESQTVAGVLITYAILCELNKGNREDGNVIGTVRENAKLSLLSKEDVSEIEREIEATSKPSTINPIDDIEEPRDIYNISVDHRTPEERLVARKSRMATDRLRKLFNANSTLMSELRSAWKLVNPDKSSSTSVFKTPSASPLVLEYVK